MKELSRMATELRRLAEQHADGPPMTAAEAAAFSQAVPDEVWLATVVDLLSDTTKDLELAADIVERNRTKCLVARHECDFEPWEMAQYAAAMEGY